MRKIFNELPMTALGVGAALVGVSFVSIGASVVQKNIVNGGIAMVFGVFLAKAGTQVTLGSIDRLRGMR